MPVPAPNIDPIKAKYQLSAFPLLAQSGDRGVQLCFVPERLVQSVRQLGQDHTDVMSEIHALPVGLIVGSTAHCSMQKRERVVAVDQQADGYRVAYGLKCFL